MHPRYVLQLNNASEVVVDSNQASIHILILRARFYTHAYLELISMYGIQQIRPGPRSTRRHLPFGCSHHRSQGSPFLHRVLRILFSTRTLSSESTSKPFNRLVSFMFMISVLPMSFSCGRLPGNLGHFYGFRKFVTWIPIL